MQFSGPSRKHPRTNNFTVLHTLLKTDSFSGSRNSWRIRKLCTTVSQLLIPLPSLRTQSRIHSLTHSRTHPSTHSSFHPPTLLLIFNRPKPIYVALCQLPSYYPSNLYCVYASYQPTVNKAVPESNKWLMPDATTQVQHAVLSVQPAWAFNDPTTNLKVNSQWPGHFWPYPQWIFVCVSLLPASFSIVWYAAACKMCRTSGAPLTPARAIRLTQTPALATALMWPLLLPTVATCFGHKYASSGKPLQHIQTVRNAQYRFVSYLEISRFVQKFYGNWTE